jgi:hypothetical protein
VEHDGVAGGEGVAVHVQGPLGEVEEGGAAGSDRMG